MDEKLYKTGFIVAEMKQSENWIYNAWPLKDLINDRKAISITQEAEDKWFTNYDAIEMKIIYEESIVSFNNLENESWRV